MTPTDNVAQRADVRARSLSGPAYLLGGGALAILTWRVWTWPFTAGFDAWAYMMWGRSLLSGDRPDYLLSATTPKPMGTILGVITGPFPPRIVFALQVTLALAIVIVLIYVLGDRSVGTIAAGVGAIAFVVGADLDHIMSLSFVDAVVAALVVGTVAVGGRARTILCVVTGLFRPEGWVLAGLSVLMRRSIPMWKRLPLAGAAAVLPVAIWAGFDLVVSGDALATVHWTEETRAVRELLQGTHPTVAFSEIPGAFVGALFVDPVVGVVACVGAVGVVIGVLVRRFEVDPWLLIVLVGWSLSLFLELLFGLDLLLRYLLPVLAICSLGWAYLFGVIGRGLTAPRWIVAAATLACMAVVVAGMDVSEHLRFFRRIDHVEAAADDVRLVSGCGPIGIIGGWRARHHVPMISVISGVDGNRFDLADVDALGVVQPGRDESVIRYGRWQGGVLPAWPVFESGLGPAVLHPSCDNPAAWPSLPPEWRYPLGNPELFLHCRDVYGRSPVVCITPRARAHFLIHSCREERLEAAIREGRVTAARDCLRPQVEG